MKNKIKIVNIVGTRPNFVKISPLLEEIKKKKKIESVLINTNQHYDCKLSDIFFSELRIPQPNYNLKVGSGSHAWQTAKIIERMEPILKKESPDLVIVVGDVNSTLAGALTAAKLKIPIAHVESGLRSFDKDMPEEINRLLTDHLSSYLFVSEPSGVKNLIKEGISRKKIFLVGNIMIDTLLKQKEKALKIPILKRIAVQKYNYAVLTLHRPENIDNKIFFKRLLKVIDVICEKIEVIWPVHPRGKKRLREFSFLKQLKRIKNLKMIPPLGYLEIVSLMAQSKFVLTDSGGIQEETTVLNIPCLTLRENTERPITVNKGTNIVVGRNPKKIIREVTRILNGNIKKGKIPRYWDGKTASRIVNILNQKINKL